MKRINDWYTILINPRADLDEIVHGVLATITYIGAVQQSIHPHVPRTPVSSHSSGT